MAGIPFGDDIGDHRIDFIGVERVAGDLGAQRVEAVRGLGAFQCHEGPFGEAEPVERVRILEIGTQAHPRRGNADRTGYVDSRSTIVDDQFVDCIGTAPPAYETAHLPPGPDEQEAGKDRTGVVSLVLLGALGVQPEVIIADYAASEENIDAIADRLLASEGYKEMLEALPADTLHAAPETMVALLDQVRGRYGSMRGYAEEIGVSSVHLDRLQAELLESA